MGTTSLQSEFLDESRNMESLTDELYTELNAHYTTDDIAIITDHLNDRSITKCVDVLKNALVEHFDDPCLKDGFWQYLNSLVQDQRLDDKEWRARIRIEAFLIDDWSIYPEVRAVTRPIDEPGPEGYENLRMYTLAVFWACAGSAINVFFEPRSPSIGMGSTALQLLVAYSGQVWANFMPKKLNFGPWTFKEQMLTTLAVSAACSAPYSQDAIIAMGSDQFYGFSGARNFGFVIMLTLSSAFMGFGIAGLCRTFLVYPTRMLWYTCLPMIVMSRTLVQEDAREIINGWSLRRVEFFWIFVLANFAWYWVTNFLFLGLSQGEWITWIQPNGVEANNLTGWINGLGLNPLATLDTNVVGWGGVYLPLYIFNNQYFGMAVATLTVIIVWYCNIRWTGYIPINTNQLWANNGEPWKVSKILTSEQRIDEAAYKLYSPPYWSAGNVVSYGTFFMTYTALVVYSILNYGQMFIYSLKSFWAGFSKVGRALDRFDDRFSRAQRKYLEVPEWWFLIALVGSLSMAIALVEKYSFTNTPVWTIFLGVGLSLIFIIPTGYLYALTGSQITINVLFEMIIGYALPGNGYALLISKVFATNFLVQTDNYVTNQVMAHYSGIAPRSLFRSQMVVTAISTFVQSGIIYFQISGNINDFCSLENRQRFFCQPSRTYFNAAIQWGTVGPRRVFSTTLPELKWCFLVGVFYPLPFWLLRKGIFHRIFQRVRSRSLSISEKSQKVAPGCENWMRRINEMVILSGALGSNWYGAFGSWFIAILFSCYVRPRFPKWYAKYAFLLTCAIDVGNSYSALIMFFSTSYKHFSSIDWWGNTVVANNADAKLGIPRLAVPEKGYFGLNPGQW